MPRSNRPRRAGRTAPGGGAAGRRPQGRPEAQGGHGADREDGTDLESRLLHGGGRLETHADGDWLVRPVTGASAGKSYLCPGCRQQIAPGTPHVVAWPAEQFGAFGGPGDRRHWHTPCWRARSRRR